MVWFFIFLQTNYLFPYVSVSFLDLFLIRINGDANRLAALPEYRDDICAKKKAAIQRPSQKK